MSELESLADYPAFLAEVKERVLKARIAAGRAVNRELILLYWDIGRGIVEKQRTAAWGDAVVERLAADLRAEFPNVRGFSANNLWLMRQMAVEYTAPAFLEQAVQEIAAPPTRCLEQAVQESVRCPDGLLEQAVPETKPVSRGGRTILAQALRELLAAVPWGHHVEIMKKVKAPAARIYYLRATAQFGWSRAVLLNQLKAGAYERAVVEKKTHNFHLALPKYRPHPHDPDTAVEVRFIEVKGRAHVGEIALTTNEFKTAERLKKDFWLYAVFNCASAPELHMVQDPAKLGWKPIVKVEHYHVGAQAILQAEEVAG